MKDDFGYFGSGLEGYIQYNEAFERNFNVGSAPGSIPESVTADMEPEADGFIYNEHDTDSEDNNTEH